MTQKQLEDRIRELEQALSDSELSLAVAVEHGDFIEDELTYKNKLLKQEVDNRLQAESRLHNLVQLISQQKTDLEVLIDTVVQHGDDLDYRWVEKLTSVEEESLTDPLTQIANRRQFDRIINQEWKRGVREGSELAALMIDIDFFKQYNDNTGHVKGDETLRNLAQLLANSLSRPTDSISRIGGEEFIVLLPSTSLAGACKLAEDMRQLVENKKISHEASPIANILTISIGVAHIHPSKNTTPDALVDAADKMLYRAKSLGRNVVASCKQTNANKLSTPLIFGEYTEPNINSKHQSLLITFFPSAAPIKQRWRTNGLSADFLADYLTSFYPSTDSTSSAATFQNELKSSVSFVANELLENAMKYSADNCMLPSSLRLQAHDNSLLFWAVNYCQPTQVERLSTFVKELDTHNPMELYLQRLEENVINNSSSGLGYLTMINDYNAKIAWKVDYYGQEFARVSVAVQLTI